MANVDRSVRSRPSWHFSYSYKDSYKDRLNNDRLLLGDQNRNKTIRTKPVNSHLKSSNQPDLVTNSVGPSSAREISRLEALCETRTKELNYIKLQLKAGLVGFDSMAVLVTYLTTELDAFSCPRVSSQLKRTKTALDEARYELAELHSSQTRLEKEIQEVTAQHALLVSSLQGDHELALSTQREQLSQEHQALFNQVANQHKIELDDLKSWHAKQITDFGMANQQRMAQLTEQYNVDIKTLQGKHDNQMEELHKQHTDKLEDITHRFEGMKMSLSNKVESLRTECEDLRSRARVSEDALLRDTDTKVQLALAPFKDLPREIESLKLVIEMRNNEIRELRRQKLVIEKQLEELPAAKERVITLNQKMENLEAIVNIKSDHEKQLSDKCQVLMRKYDKETKTNKRLSMDFEELMWKAKQEFGGSTESLVKRQISRSPPSSESASPVVMRKTRSTAGSEGGRSRRSGQYLTDDYQERRLKRRSGTFLVEGKKSPTSNGKSKRHSSNTACVLSAASQSLTDPDPFDGPQPLPPPPEPNLFRERLSSSAEECEQSLILYEDHESLDVSDKLSAKTLDATIELPELSTEPCVDGGEATITLSLDHCQNGVQATVEIVEINSNPSSDSSVLSSCDSSGNFTETSIEVTISSTDFTDNSEAELEYSGLQTDV